MQKLAPEGAFKVLAEAEELERQGKKIIHFEIGQPDFETPRHITKAGINALKNGRTKYTPSLGIFPLREKIADWVTEYTKVDTSYQQVAVTPSCKTALFTSLAAVVEPGSEVIYPDPGFPAYKILIEFFGGKAIPVPLIEERKFSFDMKVLREKITKKTKIIIINSPSNPTGSIIPKQDLKEIAEIVKKKKIWILSDEIYSQIRYTNEEYTSIYSYEHMKNQTIIIDGFSKSYSMTGWRLGYLVAPKVVMERINLLLTHSVACTATFTQDAGLEALTGSKIPMEKMIKEFQRRRDYVIMSLNKIQRVTCLRPDGAFYAFPNIKSFNLPSKQVASYLLEHAGVALLDGTSFGEYGEGYLRISYATDMTNLEKGLKKIKIALEKLE